MSDQRKATLRDIIHDAIVSCYDRFEDKPPPDVVTDDVIMALTYPPPMMVAEDTEIALFLVERYRDLLAEVDRLRE